MAHSAESLIFQHNPLQDAKTHFRLLRVVGVDETRPIPVHCEVTTFAIAEAPPYRAISYTWGDPACLTSILVNEQKMEVRVNCEYALKQTIEQGGGEIGDGFIWIDSICVNQRDNDEKGSQVALMGDIFRTASRVLACVGAHGDDSDFLYEYLRRKGARIARILQSNAPIYPDGSFITHSKSFRIKELAWRLKHSRSFLLRLCEAVANFLSRPYFRRVWIYQELFLGMDIRIHCGDEKVPISWLWVVTSFIQSWMSHSTQYWLFMSLDMRIVVRPTIMEGMPLLLAGAKEQPSKPFVEATEHVATLLCEDPKDRVYGILSMVPAVQGHHFQPDYTKDRMDLAVEVLRRVRAEMMSDTDYDFGIFSDTASRVGLNLNLSEEPSPNLVYAEKLRRSATKSHYTEFDMLAQRVETDSTDYWPFLGLQIVCQRQQWAFSNQVKWSGIYDPTLQPPKLTKCQQDNPVDFALGDIHLPPEAQNGDWVLIPRCYYWSSGLGSYCRVAFLARHYESERFELMGKVLITKWVSKWGTAFEKSASKFQFYCDHEDLLCLFSLCQWGHLWLFQNSELSDDYFKRKVCGERFSSYAVRTST